MKKNKGLAPVFYRKRRLVISILLILFVFLLLFLVILQSTAIQTYEIMDLALKEPSISVTPGQDTNAQRLRAVLLSMAHAWHGYTKYAFGKDVLNPLTKTGSDDMRLGATIIGSLDTLWIMEMKDEFNQARDWVRDHFDPNVSAVVSFSDTSTQILGGLLSAYRLSKDKVFLKKARMLGENLVKAIDQNTGIPYSFINLGTGKRHNPERTQWKTALSEMGSVQLDLMYLSTVTGDRDFAQTVYNMFSSISKNGNGNYGNLASLVDPKTGTRNGGTFKMSRYYDALLKLWIFLGGNDSPTAVEYRNSYDKFVKNIYKYIIHEIQQGEFVIIGDYNQMSGKKRMNMNMETCFAGGMFALGAAMYNSSSSKTPDRENVRDMNTAKQIARMCYGIHARLPTYIAPESISLENGKINYKRKANKLRFDTVETLFYLWRITHDEKYREWGWNIFTGMEKYMKVPDGGYSGIKDVLADSAEKDDVQPAWFTAGTLKYLYLLFSNDDVLPIDKYVFNANAHPYPIQEYISL